MKKEIEEKLGCTIEQLLEKWQAEKELAIETGIDFDFPTGLENLDEDEIMFMAGYCEHILGEEDRRSA